MGDGGDEAARRLGRELQRAREDAGLNQEEAAQALGVSVVTLSRRENGRTRVDAAEAARMRAVYERRGRAGGDANVSRATSRQAPPGVDPRSYWRGRMERTSELVTALRSMVSIIDDDLRDLLAGDLLAPAAPRYPPSTPEEIAAAGEIAEREAEPFKQAHAARQARHKKKGA